ncbi:MAG: Gfo/Idh/MocA family oxidoreductase [Candidatus Omnitrophica bacterium]|nr:Gfo/Idh/MocA family oxidoreductase [Candidatus Omnitrophota bacterium]
MRVAVIGVGHLGSRHAEIYAGMPGVQLVAVCDLDAARANALSQRLRCESVTDFRQLLGRIDAASLAVPTSLHAQLGQPLLASGIHLLIEKPIATTLNDADRLIRAAAAHRCALQIGHVERFNAAISTALSHLTRPRFIEVHRLSPYPFRGTDVSVILDVMIHDLDLLLLVVEPPIARIDAVGVSVLSASEDIANARVTFRSGCTANLTASRISDETMRRIRVFQEDSYLSIDYKAQTVELARLTARQARKGDQAIERVNLPVNQRPPLQDELASFIRAVTTKQPPLVSGEDGRAALALALRIEHAMRRSRNRDPRHMTHDT